MVGDRVCILAMLIANAQSKRILQKRTHMFQPVFEPVNFRPVDGRLKRSTILANDKPYLQV